VGARLGHLLGWIGNAIALMLAVFPFGWIFLTGGEFGKAGVLPIIAAYQIAGVLAFLTGRALRYVLAGENAGRAE
jgi:hypothetical protein